VDFINYISRHLIKHRILVVLSCNEFNKIRQIDNSVLIHVPMLDEAETRDYMGRLLSSLIPLPFAGCVHHRSAGNPHFIREILVDLTLRRLISYDTGYHFPANLDDYLLPSRILHSIYSRMSHISECNYVHLQKLATVCTPLSRELIIYILKLNDLELYSLLNEAIYNEILVKRGKHYYYTFPEARQRFFDETSARAQGVISRRVLRYYQNRPVEDVETCLGLIQNSELATDPLNARKYYLRLYQLQNDDFEQEKAYEAIMNVLKIDFAVGLQSGESETDPANPRPVPAADIIRDLREFHEKTEATGFFRRASFVEESADAIPEMFEKYLVLATLRMLAEDLVMARQHFEKAATLAMTGRQRVLSWLYLARISSRLEPDKVRNYLDKIDPNDLTLELRIIYTDRLAVHYASKKELGLAIRTIEDFLVELPPDHDNRVMINLAAMHNDLGVFYSDQKNIQEAEEHLNIALGIWKRHNIKRYLGLIYNNIADLNLKQGFTIKAQEYSELGYNYTSELNLTMGQALALLNQGEAYIKMGEFGIAEEKLIAARDLINSVGGTLHLDAIMRNLALAKSKIKGFGYYFQFISENEAHLIEGQINEINPLVKTYFYFLHETANLKKLRRLIRKNVQINYKHIHEEEFYHNILSLIALSAGDYETAMAELRLAMHFAGEINNNYAIAVFNVLQTNCLYGLKDYARARELAETALVPIKENRYRYWEIKLEILVLKLDLVNPEAPLRGVLRKVNDVLAICRANHYYQLEVEAWQVKLQIINDLGMEAKAKEEFDLYRAFLERITQDIDH